MALGSSTESVRLLSHEEILSLLSLPTAVLIRRAGGCNVGHIPFQSGQHGDGYLSKMAFLRYPPLVDELASRLASEVRQAGLFPTVVVGPAMVGAVLACAVARALEVPFTIVYRSKTSKTIKFHRDFSPSSGTEVLIVDDLAASGSSLTQYISFMVEAGLSVAAAAVVAARTDTIIGADVLLLTLMRSEFRIWTADECRLCRQGVEVGAANIRE